jgi:DpnII restriction endonuclease
MTGFATAYALLRDRLQTAISDAVWPSPEAGFLDYLRVTTGSTAPQRSVVTDRLDEAPMLAAAGYQYVNQRFQRDAQYDQEWARHFKRLAQRQAFPIDRESYFYRPLDLLGICIGAQSCPTLIDSDRQWLKAILNEGAARLPEHSRAHYLGAVAANQMGVTWTMHSTPRLQDLSLASLSLLYWLIGQRALATNIGLALNEQELAAAVLRMGLLNQNHCDDLADAGLILYATESIVERTIQASIEETWKAPRNTQAATALVRAVCDRFSIVANALGDRHDGRATISITDEYDVQDLLGALLKLHFADVRPEEWTPSYGGNASRMDFLLKPEQVVVEAKMTRKGLAQKELVTQLAEDILRYQSHQDCKALICFVYDPTGKCSNPTALENDLTKNHGGLQVIVIVQPKSR